MYKINKENLELKKQLLEGRLFQFAQDLLILAAQGKSISVDEIEDLINSKKSICDYLYNNYGIDINLKGNQYSDFDESISGCFNTFNATKIRANFKNDTGLLMLAALVMDSIKEQVTVVIG